MTVSDDVSPSPKGGRRSRFDPPPSKSATEFVGVTNCNLWKLEVKLSHNVNKNKSGVKQSAARVLHAWISGISAVTWFQ